MKDKEEELIKLIEKIYGMTVSNIDFKLEDNPHTSEIVHCRLNITGTKSYKNIV